MRACHRAGVPWVARGSGSGLSGGALPVEDGLLIVLSRMRRILEVDLANQRVVCEPGVTNVAISHAVGPSHFYPPDPSSQIVCSIGGNVAENSGGAHCFKYGFTTNYVTGLEVVLPDGTLVELGGKELDRPGYDLCGAFVGSEGTLGVATKITLRVIPSPEATRTLVAFFDSPHAAGGAVSDIVSAGDRPRRHRDDGPPLDRGLRGDGPARAGRRRRRGAAGRARRPRGGVRRPLRGGVAHLRGRGVVARSASPATRPSASSSGRCARRRSRRWAASARNYYVQDGVIPRTRLPEVLERIDELARRRTTCEVANVFHAGDGNLHPLVCYDGDVEGEAERAEELAG